MTGLKGREGPGGGLIYPYQGVVPRIGQGVFIAPGARVIGDVEIGDGASVWFNVVIRGDVHAIRIGSGSNIQDGTVVHVTYKEYSTTIGNNVLIGHRCMIHGCILEDGSFVGMQATVMDGCIVESGAMIAAGSLLTPGKTVPGGELWAGRPARYLRDLRPDEAARIPQAVAHYAALARNYLGDME